MGGLTRRNFLGRGSATVAAATVLASAPATAISALVARSGDAAVSEEQEVGGAVGSIEGALVAHVRDLATGEISVFNGTREVIVRDPSLASKLARAAR